MKNYLSKDVIPLSSNQTMKKNVHHCAEVSNWVFTMSGQNIPRLECFLWSIGI